MDRQIKKIFSVLFAVLIGASIIFFAWKGSTATYEGGVSGNNLWQNTLSVITQSTPLKTINTSSSMLADYDATSTMDIVSRELLTNYILAQRSNMSTTTLSDSDAMIIAQTAVSKIQMPQAVQFTISELNISNENSAASLATYMKNVGRLTQEFTTSQTKNDIEVAFTIPSAADDQKRVEDVKQNISHYKKLIEGLLATKTPSILTQPHLHLVQKYANIQASIIPMADIFTDPIRGLAALTQYRKEVDEFTLLSKEYEQYFPQTKQ